MAEQEACTALVDEATRCDEEPKTPTTPTITPGKIEGESQLLPLLQGLLDAPENDITPDSGTESGEDQRSNLIAEVQTALEKLCHSLNSDQTDISPERRSSLLQLVSKLQAGLSGSGSDRRSSTVSTGGRFHKRKNKQNRHTVGVSKEELADARKLIEQISLNELTPSVSSNKIQLSKQNSESSVLTSSANSSCKNVYNKIKNTTAKPFSSSNSTTSSVQTPTENFEGFDVLFNSEEKIDHSVKRNKPVKAAHQTAKPTLERNVSIDSNASINSIKSAYKAIQHAAATKAAAIKQSREQNETESEEEEDESSTVKGTSDLENAPLKTNPIYSEPSAKAKVGTSHEEKSSRFDTQKKLRMKRANTIDIPKPINFYEDEDDSESEQDDAEKRRNSYYALRGPINVSNPHTKKFAPTFEPKTESDKKFLAFINKHNENGSNKASIWANNTSVWGSRFGNIKNNFEKKSAQDAKSFWKSTDDTIKKSNANQFGPKISRRSARNLQQMFEEKQKESTNDEQNSVNYQHIKPSKTQTRSTNQLVQPIQMQNDAQSKLFKQQVPSAQVQIAHQQVRPSQTQHYDKHNLVTGTLQVKTNPERHYKVVPQPLLVNKFSHAPQSAFKPIKKAPPSPSNRTSLVFSPEGGEILKSEFKENGGSTFLYSPKPLSSSVENSTVTSPVISKPWINTGGSRVLSLAASKFEQPQDLDPPKPRKTSREFVPKAFSPAQQTIDRAPAYLSKSGEANSSTVRKLSGQYENYNRASEQAQPKPQCYQVKTNVVESLYTPPVKHYQPNVRVPTQTSESLYTPPVKHYQPNVRVPTQTSQNYSIRYDQPQNYNIVYDKPQPVDPQPSVPQNYSVRYDQLEHNKQQINYQPQNYSIRYDKPQPPQPQYQTHDEHPSQNYSVRYDQPQKTPTVPAVQNYNQSPHQVYQHVPGRENLISHEPVKDVRKPHTQKDVSAQPTQQKVQIIEPVVQPPKAARQISEESVHEYNAVNIRVMSGPVSQQAVTVRQKSSMSRDQHDMEAAFNLKNSLQKVSPKASPSRSPVRSPSDASNHKPKEVVNRTQSFKHQGDIDFFEVIKYKPSDCPKPTVSPSSFRFKGTFEDSHREAKSCGVVKPMQQLKVTTSNNITPVVKGQFHIPAINVKSPESPRVPSLGNPLSKSDSWHEICLARQNVGMTQKPIPKPGPVKSKSSHSLAVPKLFEAGMSKEEMVNKRKTMEAFLTGSKSPTTEISGKNVKRSINRVKTSQKVSTQSRSTGQGLSRSRTLPDMVCPNLLDENNVDKAFDELFQQS